MITSCPCCSGLDYSQCCEPFHLDKKIPATAQELMRSRYSAYTLQDANYLLATWEASKKPKAIDFSKEHIEWQRLEIIDTKKGGINDAKGIVAFKAFYNQHGQDHVMNEISRFIKLKGRWFYFDGTIKSIGKIDGQINEGKNAPCPCGSGKKFKRCCGAVD